MSMVKLQINGKIIDSNTRQGLEGLLVEAWHRSLLFNDMVGAAVTDGSGQFTIEIDDTYRFRFFYDWRSDFENMPDVYFKVYRGNRLLRSTEDSVLWNSGSARLPSQSRWRGSKAVPLRREMNSLRPTRSPAMTSRPAPVSADSHSTR